MSYSEVSQARSNRAVVNSQTWLGNLLSKGCWSYNWGAISCPSHGSTIETLRTAEPLYTPNCDTQGTLTHFKFWFEPKKINMHVHWQTVAERVVDKVDEALKADIMHWAAFYVCGSSHECDLIRFDADNLNFNCHLQEVRMRTGSKKIYHLEAWVIKVMSLYKVSWIRWPLFWS